MEFSGALAIVCGFTFIIHMTESVAYSMRLAGVRTKQIAIAMAFVTSTLLISRLSNMFQAPLIGAMVDTTILMQTTEAVLHLERQFRTIIFAGFVGTLFGAFMTPTAVGLFQKAIVQFKETGSIPLLALKALHPKRFWRILMSFKRPKLSAFKGFSWKGIPKGFLIFNIAVTSIYVIGVLCSMLAAAYIPEFRSTAIQLSGIVNGMATVMFTIFVDPPGARVTDQAVNGLRPESDVRTVVFSMQVGKMIGILIFAQLLLRPLSHYILWVTQWIERVVT